MILALSSEPEPVQYLEILVEEPSAETFLRHLLPKVLPDPIETIIHLYQGRPDLLKNLPNRLRGYTSYIDPNRAVMVLVDRDNDDCEVLKYGLESLAEEIGLLTPSLAPTREHVQILFRIAIEELEAWFFGDVPALVSAFPGVPPTLAEPLAERAKYRDPDGIRGGTSEALDLVLEEAGYRPETLGKVERARRVALHMDPDRNRSRSFQVFRDGLLSLVASD